MPTENTIGVLAGSQADLPLTAAPSTGHDEHRREGTKSANAARGRSDEPPLYTIDLALPPRERYKHVVKDFQNKLQSLTALFGELVHDIHPRLPVAPFTL